MTKIRTIYLIVAGFFFCSCDASEQGNQPKAGYRVDIFSSGTGWGYSVYKGEKEFIRQSFIPVIEGSSAFKSSAEALAAGQYVLHQLENGRSSSFTKHILDSLRINYVE
jgi:hypothetical protein